VAATPPPHSEDSSMPWSLPSVVLPMKCQGARSAFVRQELLASRRLDALCARSDCEPVIAEQLPNTFLEELTAGLRSTLGPDLVAVYLHGSAVSGGFDAGVSDIDLLVVVEHDLDADAVARIERFHAGTIERHPDWNDRLEIVYVGRRTLAEFRAGGAVGVISPGEPFHVRDGIEMWLQDFYLVRETGLALAGPAPAATIPDISWAEFIAATTRYADEVSGRSLRDATPGARAYGVLTMCRALCTVRLNRPCSKQEGAAWARAWSTEWAWLVGAAEQCRLSRGQRGLADEMAIQSAETLIGLLADAISGGTSRDALDSVGSTTTSRDRGPRQT
jgi:hypothetical protein